MTAPGLRLLGAVLLLTLLAPGARGEDEERSEPPKAHDAFLLDWVQGVAVYEVLHDFHEGFPTSPHKQDTEEYEATAKVFLLRRDGDPERVTALVDRLLALCAKKDVSEWMRARLLFALGRLGDPRAVDLLCRGSRSEVEEIASAAIEALGCFGAVPKELLFSVFGGSLRSVVLPASTSERATGTLCELIRRDPPARAEGEAPKDFRERRKQWLRRRYDVGWALLSHRGRIVVEAVIHELPRKRSPWLGFPGAQEKLVEALAANAEHVQPSHRKRLEATRDDEDLEIRARNLANAALIAIDDPETEKPRKPGIYHFGG